jgi:hypothetical protein
MSKRKQDQIGGHDPWEIEIAFNVQRGVDPDNAELVTIIYWMARGDLRPLAAALKKEEPPDPLVLDCLARLIDEGRLIVKPKGRGRPKELAVNARDIIAAKLYETLPGKHEDKLKEITERLGIGEEVARQAVTRLRKVPGAK